MYQNLANQNPIISQFNNYISQNQEFVPFQNNQLINNNVHVMNNLSDYLQQHRNIQQNMPAYQQQIMNQNNQPAVNVNKPKNINIIKEMLKPQNILKEKNNKDVEPNYQVRKDIQEQAKNGKINIKMTNAPYKSIIKDKIITKKVEDVKEEDLLVHKANKKIDADIGNFNKELNIKKEEEEKINDELKIEFSIDNYDKHKKKFEYKETFIRNLAFEENTFDETKQDFIEFYRQKQKEAEEGQKLCDQILHNIVDEGIISKDELPSEPTEENKEVDLKKIMDNIEPNTNIMENNKKKRSEKLTIKTVINKTKRVNSNNIVKV